MTNHEPWPTMSHSSWCTHFHRRLPFANQVESDLHEMAARPARRRARTPLELTDREHDVAVLVAPGYSNPEAASALYVSRKAVQFHLGSIYRKLGITSRRELRGLSL